MFFQRFLTDTLRANLANDYLLVVVGARQSGKTTLLRTLYREMEETRRPVFFLNLERLDLVHLLNERPENLFQILPPLTQPATVFIDEIQYLADPTNFLKFIHDEHKERLKLVVSGSSAFYIDTKFRDSLAGRKRIFHNHTLSFPEFLRFKQREELAQYLPRQFSPNEGFSLAAQFPVLYRTELLRLFAEFACYGGYPRVVLAEGAEEKRLVLEDLVHSSAKKDVLEAGIRSPERYFQLLQLLAAQTGGLINRNELASTLRLSAQAVEHYLYVMQKSFQIALVRTYHTNIRKELTKMPKAYFLDQGIRNYLMNNFDDFSIRADKGAFLENLVFRQVLARFPLDAIRFWRTQDKNELDFVVDGRYGFEVKASPQTFSPARYNAFSARNPGIGIDVVSFDGFQKDFPFRVWGAWGL